MGKAKVSLVDVERPALLSATAHEKGCALNAVNRELGDADVMEKQLRKSLGELKAAYKQCEATNSWSAKVGGYELSRETTQQRIIDAAQKIAGIQAKSGTKRNMRNQIQKVLERTRNEQMRVVKLREQVQAEIGNLKLKKVIEGDDGIKAALDQISDAMGDLGVNYDEPAIEDIAQSDQNAVREELFKKIMAE